MTTILRYWRDLSIAHDNGLMQKGSESPNSKLTEQQVLEIRASNLTHQALSEIYGVCRPLITNIINKKVWKHLL